MKRRLLALIAAAIMLLTLAPAVSATDTPYNGPCTTGNHPTWYAIRDVTTPYVWASATTTIRPLRGCSPGGNSDAAVVVTNLQSPNCLLQIGYMAGEDGILSYFATRADGNMGDGDSTRLDIGFYPSEGSSDTFKIWRLNASTWRLQVTSGHFGAYGYRDIPTLGCSPSTDMVWYGIENLNTGAQFGGAEAANKVVIHDMAYQYYGSPIVYYLTGVGPQWRAGITEPSCWIEGSGTYNGFLSVTGYTIPC